MFLQKARFLRVTAFTKIMEFCFNSALQLGNIALVAKHAWRAHIFILQSPVFEIVVALGAGDIKMLSMREA